MSKFQAREHLESVILPYWNNLADFENGGFTGFVGNDLVPQKNADKGVVLHSRILWFYSNVYMTVGGDNNRRMMDHAYQFLSTKCFDKENGGLYWMMTYDGKPCDTTKNCYNQAFGMYALASYYRATGCKEALRLAYSLFEAIETWCTDEYGYLEAFTADWKKPVESAICDQGVVADKTMNTLLHVLEAYTELYKADRHPMVGKKLMRCLEIARDSVYYSDFERLEVFFDSKMQPLGDIHSYGHDIEATWLLDRACDVLENAVAENAGALNDECRMRLPRLCADTRAYTSVIAKKILDCAFCNSSLNNESRGERAGAEHVDTDRIWWVQAETVVGFYNEYQKNQDKKFLDAAEAVFGFIQEFVTDKRPGSEWFWYVTKDGTPKTDHGITEPWKCPYHNGRMCLELIARGA